MVLSLYDRDTSHSIVKGSFKDKYEDKDEDGGFDVLLSPEHSPSASFVEASRDARSGALPLCTFLLHLKSTLKAFLSFQYSMSRPTKEEKRITLEVSLSSRYSKIIV